MSGRKPKRPEQAWFSWNRDATLAERAERMRNTAAAHYAAIRESAEEERVRAAMMEMDEASAALFELGPEGTRLELSIRREAAGLPPVPEGEP